MIFKRILFFIFVIQVCGVGNGSTETIPYSVPEQKVLEQFWKTVNITVVTKEGTTEKENVLVKFKEYLQQIVRNNVGKFVLISIINKLTNLPSKQQALEIQVDNQSPDFTQPTVKTHAKIKFSTVPLNCYTIDPKIDSNQIIENGTLQHVLLFHEILHWARYLTCIENPLPNKDLENSMSFFHPILSDHPKVVTWIDQLKSDYKTLFDNSNLRKVLGLKLKYNNFLVSFPELNCWKQCSKDYQEGLIPLSSHCIDLITDRTPEHDSRVLRYLRMPCLNIEEIRNIVGGKPSDELDIDEIIRNVICENGYRLFAGLPLRSGHVQVSGDHMTIIDSTVKEWYTERASLCIETVGRFIRG